MVKLVEAKELFDKAMVCPCCTNKFITQKIRNSRLRILKRDEDFLNHYINEEYPLKYNIFVCPSCGYATWENKFLEIKEEDIEIIKKAISSKWVKRDFGGLRDISEGIETQKLALLQGIVLGYSKLEIASLCLNIGWLYRIKGEEADEIRFLTLARDNFIEAYNNESLLGTNMDASKLTYLIGELSRRIGDKENSLSWFNLCIDLDSTKIDQRIMNMAREQWRRVREE